MKIKILTAVVALCLMLSACENIGGVEKMKENETPAATEVPEDVDPGLVDIIGTIWQVTELSFDGSSESAETAAGKAVMDITFTNRATGTSLTIPSFWDGGVNYKVRFAPTECGIWDYKSTCPEDGTLDGLTGTVGVNAYKGDLLIYLHGFVTTDLNLKYFIYNDGTPFLYLGDTHWNMYGEELDGKGDRAGDIETESHFKYIVDRRVSQGFTVYQSEPINAPFGRLTEGIIDEAAVEGFKIADKYYQYIAEKGLVHANAELFYTGYMTEELAADDESLEYLARYWVARFGAYPVIWTLAQECDNDFYNERGDQKFYDAKSNPWLKVAKYIHKYDAYSHPLSGHQESVCYTTVTGRGTDASLGRDNNGKSAFSGLSKEYGHTWWAAQWSFPLNTQYYMEVPKDYWSSGKPAINYEGRYAYLWTKDFGARAQGWVSFLSGMYGYGYGAADMWYYKTNYDMKTESSDGVDTITVEDKQMYWSEAIELSSGYQMGYLKAFLEENDWWKLTPDFDSGQHFLPAEGAYYAAASDENRTIVIYLYNQTTAGGTFVNSEHYNYNYRWFNPRTGEYSESGKTGKTDFSFDKPDAEDWVLVLSA